MITLSKFAFKILLSMMTLVYPGTSIHSNTVIKYCDEVCQKLEETCKVKNFCEHPTLDKYLYQQNINTFISYGYSNEEAKVLAKYISYTRKENYNEGLARYAIIAQNIADVSEKYTQKECIKKCISDNCKNACKQNAFWVWSKEELAYSIMTVAYGESGFRADVHAGLPPNGRGDCMWYTAGGKRTQRWSKKGFKDFKSCRSVCLGQINIGNDKVKGFNWSKDDLIGIDYNSTNRCVSTMAKMLSVSRGYCSNRPGDWSKQMFTAYGTGNACSLYARKKVKLDNGKTQINQLYLVKSGGKALKEWHPLPPPNAISGPLEAGWVLRRSHIFWGQYSKYKITPSRKQNSIIENEKATIIYNSLFESKNKVERLVIRQDF